MIGLPRLIGLDGAVLQYNFAQCAPRYRVVVRDQDDRPAFFVKLPDDIHDFSSRS
jgi:hypothetical protein